ncbi:hypothetical protein D043_4241B, partial [Vibrio parahaemolyticus EKP-021]
FPNTVNVLAVEVRREAVDGVVRHFDQLFIAVKANHWRDRAKDFLGDNLHVVSNAFKHHWLHK